MDAGIVTDVNRAIDGRDLVGLAVLAEADRTIDRIEVANRLAVVNADRAIHLAGVVAGASRR
ncbi:MAG: hypothetical protein IPP82_04820 [Xanthomonadales bacterium]|nr:hypothetical protein [Xanthomonadales bacterium]